MTEIINLDKKRVCDISADARIIVIKKRDCVTKITANPDGTLKITNHRTNLRHNK